jgi:hypothetical protein
MGNDGYSTQNWPPPRQANQDKMHFPLGSSPARPASGYFADVLGIANEQMIRDQMTGLSEDKEIEETLFKLFWNRDQAHSFMYWRLGMKKYAPGPKGDSDRSTPSATLL